MQLASLRNHVNSIIIFVQKFNNIVYLPVRANPPIRAVTYILSQSQRLQINKVKTKQQNQQETRIVFFSALSNDFFINYDFILNAINNWPPSTILRMKIKSQSQKMYKSHDKCIHYTVIIGFVWKRNYISLFKLFIKYDIIHCTTLFWTMKGVF